MGCAASDLNTPSVVPQNRSFRSTMNQHNGNNSDSDIRVESIQRYDEQIIETITRDLKESPQTFVLNNVLMSIQFFDNYRKEINKFQHTTASKMEKQLNRKLLKDETMGCTNPDIIFEKVRENVRYRPLHGPKKNVSEPLVAKRIYVINDSIEVINSVESPQYTSIDKPGYLVRTEESAHKGFVRLRHIETSRKFDRLPDAEPVYEPIPGPSTASSDSEIYSYNTITEMGIPKPIKKGESPDKADTLPDSCFTQRKIRRKLSDMNLDSDEDEDENDSKTEDDFFDTVVYINSKGFMKYFQNVLFPNSLGRTLGFDEMEISLAKAIRGKVFCNETDEMDNVVPCEIIPSIAIEWPAEQTYEFFLREERPTYTYEKTGFRFRWPTDEMLRDIKGMSCVLVPKGYVRKRGKYPDTDIEWEIHCPKAERYIEARMTHAQMKCFLFMLTIHKTYIEPATHQNGLLPEHIRAHMYWECETHYQNWPEHRLATKMMKVIQNLHDRISKGVLPDYFIKRKNLFQNIPSVYLQSAQKILHDILQSPAMYFIKALRNLRYTSGKFYAPLNFKHLYEILTNKGGLSLINPAAITPPNKKKKRYKDPEKQYEIFVEQRARQQYLKRKEAKEQALKENLRLQEERKNSIDSIDLEWVCERNFDIYKTKELLKLFINNFLEIQKRSLKFSTIDQTRFYLKQAWYLTRILEGTAAGFKAEAREHLEKIAKEEEICNRIVMAAEDDETPPTIPFRNSMSLQHDISQQLKNNIVNLNNLQKSYSSAFQLAPAMKHKKSEAKGAMPRKSVAFVEV